MASLVDFHTASSSVAFATASSRVVFISLRSSRLNKRIAAAPSAAAATTIPAWASVKPVDASSDASAPATAAAIADAALSA